MSPQLTCPSCGATDIEVTQDQRQLALPFTSLISVKTTQDRCRVCGMIGDFEDVNDAVIEKALSTGKEDSVRNIMAQLDEQGYGMARMERALELAPRTMMRWKGGRFSDGALALLRIVATYPWTIDVADAQFEPLYATRRLAQEGLSAMGQLAQASNMMANVQLLSVDENEGFDATLRIRYAPKGIATSGTFSNSVTPKMLVPALSSGS